MLILETPRLILRPFQDSDLEPFVAYRSDPEVARYQGWEAPYSVESAMEFIYAFRDLGLHRVVASCDVDNLASARLLERVGMRREGHFIENIWFKGAWGSVNGPVCPAKSSAPDNGLNPPPAGSPPAGDFSG